MLIPKYPKGDELKLSDEFQSTDFDCKCFRPDCQVTLVDPKLVEGLDALVLIFPIITINSGFRCAAHNKEVGGAPHSLHLQGRAADISTPFAAPQEVRKAAEKIIVFNQGGIAQYRHHVHVDTRSEKWEIKKGEN